MRLQAAFIHSHTFYYDKEGNAYSEGKLTYETWQRYLGVFNNLVVVGRYKESDDIFNFNISSGANVVHVKMPNVSVSFNSLKKKNTRLSTLKSVIEKSDVVIARLPSQEGMLGIQIAKELNKPYVIELVGDVFSALWYHGSFLRKVYAPIAFLKEKKILKDAPYVLYVTESYLQNRYPSKKIKVSASCSNVELKDNLVVFEESNKNIDTFKIGLIGSYSSKYKGIDNALSVVKKLVDNNIQVELRILGTGNAKNIINLSKELGIERNIKLDGSLPAGNEVFKWLNELDLYIQPSLTEGLPRALIEAMYMKLPCVASDVGGISELLENSVLHKPKDEQELYLKIFNFINDSENRRIHGIQNGVKANEYLKSKLDEKRSKFWQEVINDIRRNE